jgi:hypothetical protein
MKLSQLLKQFIDLQLAKHPQLVPWLADWSIEWETQVMADVEGLEPQYATLEALRKGEPSFWVDSDGYKHFIIRIPKGSMTETPSFTDWPVLGPIHNRWTLIGNTGWNWKQQKSMFVGFDFDGITEQHKDGLVPEQIEEIKNRAISLPYVVARTSKSGHGIHLIAPLKPWIPTQTHKHHSRLAREVLKRMSADCGFDFSSSVDPCGVGGNLWNFSRGVTPNGLRRI